MKTPDISIVVSNWNTSHLLNEALESIVTTAGDINFDVTVIDDGSTDGDFIHVDDKFKRDPRFSFVRNETNVGFFALNIMLERTQAKYIMHLDNDARLKPGALQALYTFMESHPKAGAATANLLNPDGSLQNYYRRILTPSFFFYTTVIGRFIDKYFLGLRNYNRFHYQELDFKHVAELEQPPTACLILRREALGDYILDTYGFLYIDVDMSKRMYNKGYKSYLIPDAYAVHLKSVSFSNRSSKSRQREHNRCLMIYMRKHYPYQAPLVWLALQLDRALRFLMRKIIGREPMR
jgi:hypothetical protein